MKSYLTINSVRLQESDRMLGLYFDQSEHHQYPRLIISSVSKMYKDDMRTFIRNAKLNSVEFSVRDNAKIIKQKPFKTTFTYSTKVFHLTVILMTEVDRLLDDLEKLSLVAFDHKSVNELIDEIKVKFYHMMDIFYKVAESIKISRNGNYYVIDVAAIKVAQDRYNFKIGKQCG